MYYSPSFSDLSIFTGLDSATSLRNIVQGPLISIVCFEIGGCAQGLLEYENYFNSILDDKKELNVIFLFLGRDSVELVKFVNGYETKLPKGGILFDDLNAHIGFIPPVIWPTFIISIEDSLFQFNIPSPQLEEFLKIEKFLW